MKLKKLLYLPIFLAFIFLGANAPQERFYGEISDLAGKVELLPQGETQWLPALDGIPVMVNTRIKTGADSGCNILIDDGSLMHVPENTDAVLEALVLAPGSHNSQWYLFVGKLLISANSQQNLKMEVKTPVSIAAVRGTEFAVEYSSETAAIGVFEGSVEVSNPAVSGTGTMLTADNETLVIKGELPSRPEKLKEIMRKNKERLQSLRGRMKELKETLSRKRPEELAKTREKVLSRFERIKKERQDIRDRIRQRDEDLKKSRKP